ncbi:MAG TPA: hypothetical protein VN230_08390 [Burkholderiaceae bacterium]|nr:hypothetical protein [Burkholderiaceae bacterium]
MKSAIILALATLLAPVALAKLPPLSDEAKAKAAEAAAKTAWNGKVDAYQLCRAQERVAASFFKSAKAAGKEVRPAMETPACADPGPFVYTPVAAAAPAPAPASPAAPAAPTVAPAGKS